MEMNKSREEMMRKKSLMIFVGGLLACGYPALAQRSDGKLVKGRLHTVIYQKNGTTAEGYLQLLPGIHDTDGFFIARLKRKRV